MIGVDPLDVLANNPDAASRAWAVAELRRAGFAAPERIASDLHQIARRAAS